MHGPKTLCVFSTFLWKTVRTDRNVGVQKCEKINSLLPVPADQLKHFKMTHSDIKTSRVYSVCTGALHYVYFKVGPIDICHPIISYYRTVKVKCAKMSVFASLRKPAELD